jgi:hypothetical protein
MPATFPAKAADDPSLIVCRKFHHCCGYVCVAVISVLAGDVKVFNLVVIPQYCPLLEWLGYNQPTFFADT